MLLQTIDRLVLNEIPLAVDGMEADHQELSEASPVLVTRGKMSSSDDPDTISDESGYSEESNATLSSAGSKINSKSAPSSAGLVISTKFFRRLFTSRAAASSWGG